MSNFYYCDICASLALDKANLIEHKNLYVCSRCYLTIEKEAKEVERLHSIVINGYLEAILFSEKESLEFSYMGENNLNDFDEIDIDFYQLDFCQDSKDKVKELVINFFDAADQGEIFIDDFYNLDDNILSQIGHDLYFSSNGHGVGFIDRLDSCLLFEDEEILKELDTIAKNLNSYDLFLSDDKSCLIIE